MYKLGGHYWISGCQLGLISSLAELENDKKIKEILEEIQDKQFIGSEKDLENLKKKKK